MKDNAVSDAAGKTMQPTVPPVEPSGGLQHSAASAPAMTSPQLANSNYRRSGKYNRFSQRRVIGLPGMFRRLVPVLYINILANPTSDTNVVGVSHSVDILQCTACCDDHSQPECLIMTAWLWTKDSIPVEFNVTVQIHWLCILVMHPSSIFFLGFVTSEAVPYPQHLLLAWTFSGSIKTVDYLYLKFLYSNTYCFTWFNKKW